MELKTIFNIWIDALKDPKRTFSSEKVHASFGDGAVNIILGAIIAGIIDGIWTIRVTGIIGLTIGPIYKAIGQILVWLIWGGIVYIFAKIFGGRGDYMPQIYLMSLYTPAILIISSIIRPIPYIGKLLDLIVAIYSLYLLTLALKEAHSFSIGKATLSWVAPLLIIIVIAIVLIIAAYSIMAGILGSMMGGAI